MVIAPELDLAAIAGEAQKTALVILGAGQSQRFGTEDKLAALLDGQPLAHHILRKTMKFDWAERILVSSHKATWHDAYIAAGFSIIPNLTPEDGLAASLQLGIRATSHSTQVLICLADMPLIETAHIARMLHASACGIDQCFATRSADYLGPPALLPRDALLALPQHGENGARNLIRNGTHIETELAATHDVDLPADMLLAADLLRVRQV